MVRIFIYEYASAAGAGLPSSLRAEGQAMLSAIQQDFSAVNGVEVVTLKRTPGKTEKSFRGLAGSSDYTVVIAPEFEDILLRHCRWVIEEGGRLLGPSVRAVQLAGDKLALAEHLHRRGIPTPVCRAVGSCGAVVARPPCVWKPRFGAGSMATYLIQDADDWATCHEQARVEGWDGESLIQPYVPGRAVSVAFLTGRRGPVALSPVAQELSADGRLRYLGGYLPIEPDLAARAISLGRRAVEAVEGLAGYVGVDLVLGSADDGSEDWLIEINPRVTTSYVGLRRHMESNLADAMLRTALGEPVELKTKPVGVRFRANGTVRECRHLKGQSICKSWVCGRSSKLLSRKSFKKRGVVP
jgi:predicted ATP-grasp superfamily ATP-dependent carboligase